MTAVMTGLRQEWMGHRDIATTQRYADYAPRPHEEEMVAAAFGRDARGGGGDVPLRLVEG